MTRVPSKRFPPGYSYESLVRTKAASHGQLAVIAAMADADADGRRKVVLSGAARPVTVEYFMKEWAPAQDLVDIYGVPQRGFAGGYLA